jgi:dGTPase
VLGILDLPHNKLIPAGQDWQLPFMSKHVAGRQLAALNLREQYELRENKFISPYGCLSSQSRGRSRLEPLCPIRTSFQVDRDRILFSNAFRRLKHKTQVFLNPLGDEYRTRLTHTLEVAQIARTIARAMFLNEDLTEAIALGHDLGHPPFGHGGELVLQEVFGPSFTHQAQSLRVIQVLENGGKGLNLTYEVRDGILKHSKGYGNIMPEDPKEMACTVEGRVVRVADIMAYLNHDLDDAIRSGVIQEKQIPQVCIRVLGLNHQTWLNAMISDLIYRSTPQDGNLVLAMSDDVFDAMSVLRQFLYDNVYRSSKVHSEFVKAKRIMVELFEHFLRNEDQLRAALHDSGMSAYWQPPRSPRRVVCDFMASLTDRYALNLYARTFFPSPTV